MRDLVGDLRDTFPWGQLGAMEVNRAGSGMLALEQSGNGLGPGRGRDPGQQQW